MKTCSDSPIAPTATGWSTAREMARLVPPPFASRRRSNLPRRQVRRCPYLFSVAPADYRAEVEPLRVPPSRPGFPSTHALLEESWRLYLAAMEQVLAVQSWLLGSRFTVADASAYGQLSMNLIDPTSAARLEQYAPRTFRWLLAIRDGEHRDSAGELAVNPELQALLAIIMKTFAPLMVQNERAYLRAVEAGATVFNGAASDAGAALYDGELLGHPFRSVVKTFQVRVWRELCGQWRGLDEAARGELEQILPDAHLLQGSDEAPGLTSWSGRR